MDYKLRLFREVAQTKSFTKAAQNLHLSQPAVSKAIKTLETQYGKAFFDRQPNRISLTAEGAILLTYSEKILRLYEELHDEFSTPNHLLSTELKIGASTTIANYILPELISNLQAQHPDLRVHLIAGNTDKIQRLTLEKQLDLGIVEGHNHNNRLQYTPFIEDELVLVGPVNRAAETSFLRIEDLKKLPFVERELGSGTREVIENSLRYHGLSQRYIQSILGSTESIKSYLQHSNRHHYAFLSIHALHQELLEHRLQVYETDDLSITRRFHFISRQGDHSKRTEKIQSLLICAYNQR